jgi:hypothetical protein
MHTFHWPHWHRADFTASEILWAAMALLGALAMVFIEAIGMRVFAGKW